MKRFMKNHKLLAQGKKFLALLLAVAMVTGALPASSVSAAEASATVSEDVAVESTADNTADTTTAGTGDGEDSNLIKYTIDTTEYDEYLKRNGYSTVAQWGSYDPYYWSSSYYRSRITVLKDGEELGTLNSLAYLETPIEYTEKWQVKNGDKFVDMENAPVRGAAVGTYKLVISIAAVENVSAAMDAEVIFQVVPRKVTPNVTIDAVEPGTLVKDVVAAGANININAYNPYNSNVYYSMTTDAETSQLKVALEITDAYTGEVLGADTALMQNGDYNVKITTTFTDKVEAAEQANFSIQVIERRLQMAGLIEPEVHITMTDKWKNNNETPDNADDDYYEDYTTTFDGEDVEAPVENTDYTMQVRYWDHFDYEKNEDVWNVITPAEGEITYAWYATRNASVPMDEAPVDAGTYYYGIKYAGQAGLYAEAENRIKVVVEKKELTLVPKWKDGVPTFYPGMSEADVLDYVDYDAVDESGNVVDIDKEHIWGTRTNANRTFSYTPEFKLQVARGEGETKNYTDNYDSLLEATGDKLAYRVVFTGNKGIYYLGGGIYSSRAINNYSYNADPNYVVNVETETLEAKVLNVTVDPGVAAKIDVSAMLQGEAGNAYTNPISKVYDGAYLFNERAEYKLAKVTELEDTSKVVASDVDSSLTYTWYVQEGTVLSGENEVPNWVEAIYRNSPVSAGNYMLMVTYQDPENVYHAAAAAVYFEIKPQLIKVVPTVVPSVLTETNEEDYDYANVEYVIKAVTYEEATQDGNDATQDGNDSVEINLVEGIDYAIGQTYLNYDGWGIEEATAEKPEEYNDFYGTFTKGNKYQLEVTEFYLYNDNYADYVEVVEGEGENAVTVDKYLHEKAPIELHEMGANELVLTPDVSKLSATTKVYDGVAWDLSADIANGLVKATKKSDGSAVADLELTWHWYYGEEVDVYSERSSAPYRAGTYTIGVSYAGDTNYHATEVVKVATVTITPTELIIEPVVEEPVVAGTYAYNVFSYSNLKFEGVVARDQNRFVYDYYGDDGYYAIDSYDYSIKDENGTRVTYSILRGEKTYTLEFSCELLSTYAACYNVTVKPVTFTTVRGNSVVNATNWSNIEYAEIVDTVTGMDHVIQPIAGVPYSYDANIDGKEVPGNYVAFEITRPSEYNAVSSYDMATDASFANSIVAAGGYVLSTDNNYAIVAFDASAKDVKEFSICWEPGYIENFKVDFSKAILLADLRSAVDAKSISLISPVKKMVVGGTQQLDVKLTKKQMADVIYLGYSVDNKDVLCVSDDGYITALKPGKATVTVFSARYDETTHKAVAIEGAKTAKLTITVTDVSAPKIKKVHVWDYSATVELPAVKDGYRREVYVLEGKNVSATEFESRIAAMEEQHWQNFFAMEPTRTFYSSDYKTEYGYINGLDIETDYTVYVRNVSAVRTSTMCDERCEVSASVKGVTKSFKTTKSQVVDLLTYYDAKQPVTYNELLDRFEVKLTSKKLTVSAMGEFWEDAVNPAAESYDTYWYDLPLKGDQKKNYVSPKLTYYVAARYTYNPGNYYDYDGYYYYAATPLATIAKNGKMTLKGAGTVYVAVEDTTTGVISEFQPLTITVSPDKITPNKVTLKVGQSMNLTSMVTYYEGKTKLSGDFSRYITLSAESKQAIADSEYFKLDESGTKITAIKPGGTLANLTLNEVYYGLTATVSVKSADIAPVKALKTSYLADTKATMSFTYDGYANYFKVDVLDERGRLVSSDLRYKYNLSRDYSKGKYTYYVGLEDLVKQSKYTVQITAIYQDGQGAYAESKMVKKSIKTTKIPVSYKSLSKTAYNTGLTIYEATSGYSVNNLAFRTGNSYTLLAMADIPTTADSLIWTSSNKKVATVKANAGGDFIFSAELKALRAGTTTIEVKSKITKQVVARYIIYVDAVGNATEYYGDQLVLQSVDAE